MDNEDVSARKRIRPLTIAQLMCEIQGSSVKKKSNQQKYITAQPEMQLHTKKFKPLKMVELQGEIDEIMNKSRRNNVPPSATLSHKKMWNSSAKVENKHQLRRNLKTIRKTLNFNDSIIHTPLTIRDATICGFKQPNIPRNKLIKTTVKSTNQPSSYGGNEINCIGATNSRKSVAKMQLSHSTSLLSGHKKWDTTMSTIKESHLPVRNQTAHRSVRKALNFTKIPLHNLSVQEIESPKAMVILKKSLRANKIELAPSPAGKASLVVRRSMSFRPSAPSPKYKTPVQIKESLSRTSRISGILAYVQTPTNCDKKLRGKNPILNFSKLTQAFNSSDNKVEDLSNIDHRNDSKINHFDDLHKVTCESDTVTIENSGDTSFILKEEAAAIDTSAMDISVIQSYRSANNSMDLSNDLGIDCTIENLKTNECSGMDGTLVPLDRSVMDSLCIKMQNTNIQSMSLHNEGYSNKIEDILATKQNLKMEIEKTICYLKKSLFHAHQTLNSLNKDIAVLSVMKENVDSDKTLCVSNVANDSIVITDNNSISSVSSIAEVTNIKHSPTFSIPRKSCLRKTLLCKSLPSKLNSPPSKSSLSENKALSKYMDMKKSLPFLKTPVTNKAKRSLYGNKENVTYSPSIELVSMNVQKQLDQLFNSD